MWIVARVAFSLASCAGALTESGGRRRACAVGAALSALPLLRQVAYTRVSLLAMAAGLIVDLSASLARRPPGPLPVLLFVNSVGVASGFRWAAASDPAAVSAMARACRCSDRWITGAGCALVHEVPSALALAWVARRADDYSEAAPPGPALGLATASAQMMWSMLAFGSNDVTPAYVPMGRGVCEAAWAAAVLAHVGAGCLWLALARGLRGAAALPLRAAARFRRKKVCDSRG